MFNYTVCSAVLLLPPSAVRYFRQRKGRKGVGIVGATVLVTGSNTGAATDIDGNFRIDNVSGTAVSLTVSSVGYTTQVVKVDFAGRNSASVQVVLVEDYKLLDEVVVVAYGTRKRRSHRISYFCW